MENRRPKIWILVLAVLTAAALVYTFAGASSLKDTANKAEFTQKTVYGDASAAEGVSVTYTNIVGANRQVKWTTDLTVNGGKVDPELNHKYLDNEYGQSGEPFRDRIEIYPDLNDVPELKVLAKEAARGLKVYERTEITIDLSEYLEYIPVTAQYAVGQLSYSIRLDDPARRALSGMFRIKTPDDVKVTLNVYRNPDAQGEVACNYDVWQIEESSGVFNYGVIASGPYVDGAFYIFDYDAYRPYRYAPGVLEPSADGSNPYKIYRIPAKSETVDEMPRYTLDVDKATVIGEFEQSHKPIQAAQTADGSKVMILGTAEDRFKAYVVDLKDGGRAQTLDLCAAGPYKDAVQMHYDVFFKDDYFVLNNMEEGYYAVYPKGNDYAVFHAPTDGKAEASELARFRQQYWDQKPYDVTFENGRLVAAGFAGERTENVVDGQVYPYMIGDSICLAVYTKDGLQYFTRYASTLYDMQYHLIGDHSCSVEIH